MFGALPGVLYPALHPALGLSSVGLDASGGDLPALAQATSPEASGAVALLRTQRRH